MSVPRVLIIESDSDTAAPLRTAFESEGAEVEVTGDGEAGLARAESWAPGIVVLSAELSGAASGYAVCQRLKQTPSTRDIPVLLTSAKASEEIFAQHARMPTRAQGYFRKPVTPGALVDAARDLVPFGAMSDSSVFEVDDDDLSELLSPSGEAAAFIDSGESAPERAAAPDLPDEAADTNAAVFFTKEEAPMGDVPKPWREPSRSTSTSVTSGSTEFSVSGPSARTAVGPERSAASARELLALREAINQKEREVLALKDEIFKRDHAVIEAEERAELAERRIGDAAQAQQRAEAALDEARRLQDEAEAARDFAQAQVEQVGTERDEAREALAALEAERDSARKEADELRARVAAIEAEREAERADAGQAATERDALRLELQNARANFETEIGTLVRAHADELEQERAAHAAATEALQAEHEADLAAVDGARARLAEKVSALRSAAEATVAQANEIQAAWESKVHAAEAAIMALGDDLQALSTHRKALRERITSGAEALAGVYAALGLEAPSVDPLEPPDPSSGDAIRAFAELLVEPAAFPELPDTDEPEAASEPDAPLSFEDETAPHDEFAIDGSASGLLSVETRANDVLAVDAAELDANEATPRDASTSSNRHLVQTAESPVAEDRSESGSSDEDLLEVSDAMFVESPDDLPSLDPASIVLDDAIDEDDFI